MMNDTNWKHEQIMQIAFSHYLGNFEQVNWIGRFRENDNDLKSRGKLVMLLKEVNELKETHH